MLGSFFWPSGRIWCLREGAETKREHEIKQFVGQWPCDMCFGLFFVLSNLNWCPTSDYSFHGLLAQLEYQREIDLSHPIDWPAVDLCFGPRFVVCNWFEKKKHSFHFLVPQLGQQSVIDSFDLYCSHCKCIVNQNQGITEHMHMFKKKSNSLFHYLRLTEG